MTYVHRNRRASVQVDWSALEAGMILRGLQGDQFAKLAGIHKNTLQNIKRTGRAELGTVRRLALVLETVQPLASIQEILQRKVEVRPAMKFPCSLDVYVLQRLPIEDPALAAEWKWANAVWAQHPELHREWQRFVADLRSGNLSHSRDYNLGDLLVWLRERVGSTVGPELAGMATSP